MLAALVLVAIVTTLGLRLRAGTDRGATDSPLLGRPAPDFSLPVLGEPDRRIGNRDLLGDPFVLNVWRSGCGACRAEHTVVSALARSGRVRVVGYNHRDTPGAAQQWLAQLGDPYWASVVDADGSAARDWGIRDAPETFLVDARGIVRWKFAGPLTQDVVDADILPTLESAR
jgi:cytochrome c biogenesis protein CcmG/thiol:disulfide interchange protein DsbE